MSKITEPVTMLTDYILAGYCFVLSFIVLKETNPYQETAGFLMGITLISTGIGAFIGGTSHGFKEILGKKINTIVWKSTLYTLGISSLLFIISAVLSSVKTEIVGYPIILVGLISFIIYSYWMIDHDEFKYVIMEYGSAMMIVIILKIYSFYKYGDPSSWWIIGGIIITIIASMIQAFGITIHPKYFNHNDLFHVIQIPGVYMLYRGSLLMIDML